MFHQLVLPPAKSFLMPGPFYLMGTAWIPLEGHTENTPSCVFVLITCGTVVGASPPRSSLGMKVAMTTLIHIHAQHLAPYMTMDSQSTANHPFGSSQPW